MQRTYEIIGGELFVSPISNIRINIFRSACPVLFQYLQETGEREVLTAPMGCS
jgi:hypothetical protein